MRVWVVDPISYTGMAYTDVAQVLALRDAGADALLAGADDWMLDRDIVPRKAVAEARRLLLQHQQLGIHRRHVNGKGRLPLGGLFIAGRADPEFGAHVGPVRKDSSLILCVKDQEEVDIPGHGQVIALFLHQAQ